MIDEKTRMKKDNLSEKRLFVHAKTLKDGKQGITWGGWIIPDCHVKEKIQNALRRLKDEIMHGFIIENDRERELIVAIKNEIDKIFKEEFGDQLI